MSTTDYSDRAIALRIHQVSQLRRLCLSLAGAKRLSPPETSSAAPPVARPQQA